MVVATIQEAGSLRAKNDTRPSARTGDAVRIKDDRRSGSFIGKPPYSL